MQPHPLRLSLVVMDEGRWGRVVVECLAIYLNARTDIAGSVSCM